MSTQIATITPKRLHDAQRRGCYSPLLDVRTAAEYPAGHIPGAQLSPSDPKLMDVAVPANRACGSLHAA